MPSFVIGMCGLAIFGFTGIIKDSDMGTGVSWTLLLFIGGVFSLQTVVQAVKITDWLGGYFIPVALQLTSNHFLLIAVMCLSVLILRFIDPTGFIVIPVLFLPLVDVLMKAGINPLVVVAPTTVASAPVLPLLSELLDRDVGRLDRGKSVHRQTAVYRGGGLCGDRCRGDDIVRSLLEADRQNLIVETSSRTFDVHPNLKHFPVLAWI